MRRPVSAVLTAAVVVAALTGCGGSDEQQADAATTTDATATPESSRSPAEQARDRLVTALEDAGIEPPEPMPTFYTEVSVIGAGTNDDGEAWVADGFPSTGLNADTIRSGVFMITDDEGWLALNLDQVRDGIPADADRCFVPWTQNPAKRAELPCTTSTAGADEVVVNSYSNLREIHLIRGNTITNINVGSDREGSVPPIDEATQRELVAAVVGD